MKHNYVHLQSDFWHQALSVLIHSFMGKHQFLINSLNLKKPSQTVEHIQSNYILKQQKDGEYASCLSKIGISLNWKRYCSSSERQIQQLLKKGETEDCK